MGLTEILTIIFVVLKLVGVITWSWLWVFSPLIIVYGIILALYLLGCALTFLGIATVDKSIKRGRW
ncbi:hypothetical protein ACE1MS_11805 [Lysinibacillus sp. fkY74-1]